MTTAMKMTAVIVVSALASQVAFAASNEVMTEEHAQAVREGMGIQTVTSNQQYLQYSYRNDGKFIISREKFVNLSDAVAFCNSVSGYQLTGRNLHTVLTMMGLPFVDLYNTAQVSQPVLGDNGGRTGVIFWSLIDISQVPDARLLSARDQEALKFIEAGDYIVADLNNDSGIGSGPHQLSKVNARLAALSKSPVSLHAVCEDSQLRAKLTK